MHPINIRFNSDSLSLSQLNERLSKCYPHSLAGLGLLVEEGIPLTSLTFQQFKAALTPFLKSFAATCSESDLNEFRILSNHLFSEQAGSSSGRIEIDDIIDKIKGMQSFFKPSTLKVPLDAVPTFGNDMYRHLFSFLSSPAEKVAFLFSYEMAHYQEISWEEAISRASQLWTTLSSPDILELANMLPGFQSIETKKEIVLNALRLSNVTTLSFSSLSDHTISAKQFNLLISKCPILENLDLTGCQWATSVLSGSLPELARLQQINLSMSNIYSEVALSMLLQKCPLLKILNLNMCKAITGESLAAISLSQVEELHLRDSGVTQKGLEILLQKCPKLTSLDLSDCGGISGDLLLNIPLLAHLRDINLDGSKIKLNILEPLLQACLNLRRLDVRDVGILTSKIISAISHLPELKELFMNANLVEENLKALLQNHSGLKTIMVELASSTTGESLESIPLTQLEKIEIDGTGITDAGFEILLRKCPQAKKISLLNRSLITGESLKDTLPLEQVEELYLGKTGITEIGFRALLHKFPRLRSLTFSSGKEITQEALKAIPLLTHLTYLYFHHSDKITDECLAHLLSLCPKLKFLTLSHCRSLTGRFLTNIPLLSELEEIFLEQSSFTDVGFTDLLSKSPNLKRLKLNDCLELRGERYEKIPFLISLKRIDADGCSISQDGYLALLSKAPNLVGQYIDW
jgi:hypothetical protein